MTTVLLTHPAFREHATPPGHPERPDRLDAIEAALKDEAFAALSRHSAPMASADTARLVHADAHVDSIARARPRGEAGGGPGGEFVRIDADTSMSPGSWEAALRAIGAATAAIDLVVTGAADNAFCAVRPPGHHAETGRAMGFCLFNNVAIAARHAQRQHGIERVAIIDFDVHHGNGTQDIFCKDPDVFYGSTHQMPLYPGTGAREETGAGNVFNAPLAAGAGTRQFREAMNGVILPALDRFSPDLVLVSAGFDAHWRDPLAALNLQDEDFVWITRQLMQLAEKHCDNRLVSLLEGGYDLHALANSVAGHVATLMRG